MAKGLNRKERKAKGDSIPLRSTVSKVPQKKYLEKKIRRYIMASADTGQYLVVIPGKHRYLFTKNIIQATKCMTPFDAKTVIRDYHIDTGDMEFAIVVIPLEITYELINKTISSSIEDSDYLEDLCRG